MKGVIRVSTLLVVTLCGNIACGSDTAGTGEGAGGDGSTPLPLIVSIAGAPDPEQIFDGSAPIPNFGVEAVSLQSGSRVQLKIELVEPGGERQDVTGREELSVSSAFYKVHVCDRRALCVWPRPGSESGGEVDSLPYGRARVEAQYMLDDGRVAYGGFYVDVQEAR